MVKVSLTHEEVSPAFGNLIFGFVSNFDIRISSFPLLRSAVGLALLAGSVLVAAGCEGPFELTPTERKIGNFWVDRKPDSGCRDSDGDGYGDFITLSVMMFSARTRQACVADGHIKITLYSVGEHDKLTKIKDWDFDPEQVRRGTYHELSVGPTFWVGLKWPEHKVRGWAELRVEFFPTGGGLRLLGRPQRFSFQPIAAHAN